MLPAHATSRSKFYQASSLLPLLKPNSTEPHYSYSSTLQFKILPLLKREDNVAQSHAVTFITFDGFGDIRDGNPSREFDSLKVVIIDSDQYGVVLAGFELQIVGEIVTQPNGAYGIFDRHPFILPRHHLILLLFHALIPQIN